MDVRALGWVAIGTLIGLTAFRLSSRTPLAAHFGASKAFYAADGSLLRVTLAPDGQYLVWTELSEIAPEMVNVSLFYEDRYFY